MALSISGMLIARAPGADASGSTCKSKGTAPPLGFGVRGTIGAGAAPGRGLVGEAKMDGLLGLNVPWLPVADLIWVGLKTVRVVVGLVALLLL
jgi:hypothetical protein